MLNFCRNCLEAGKPGSMYISGPPGTGKSLTLRELETAVREWADPPAIVSVNCMTLHDPRAVRCCWHARALQAPADARDVQCRSLPASLRR